MPSAADQKHVHDTILTEAGGDLRTAYQMACARLALALHGASFAYLRRMDPAAELKLDSDPPVDDGEWLRTGVDRA